MRTPRNFALALITLQSLGVACSEEGTGPNPNPTRDAGMTQPPVDCPASTGLTVCDLKNEGGARRPAIDDPVVLEGIMVTTQPYVLSAATTTSGTDLLGFFAQDTSTNDALQWAYSGIQVTYRVGAPGVPEAPAPGDVIRVEGKYTEFPRMGTSAKQKQVEATFIMRTGTTQVAPKDVSDPQLIATGGSDAARYEGVLVRVANVTAAVVRDVPGVGSNKIFGAFQLAGGLVVKNDIYDYPAAMGEQFASLAGVLKIGTRSFDAGIYQLLPRGPEDVVSSVPPITSIATLQNPAAPGRPTVCVNMGTAPTNCPKVLFEDVVVTALGGYVSANLRAGFLQDPRVSDGRYAGVMFTYGRDVDLGVVVGDRVRASGEAVEYYGATQIQRLRLTKLSGGSVPAPVIVNPSDIARTAGLDNPYEGVLVQVNNVTVTQRCVPAGSMNQDFGYWEITGPVLVGAAFEYDYIGTFAAAGTCNDPVRMNDQRTVGHSFQSIAGVVDYAFNELRLQPRQTGDLVRN